MQRVSIFTTDKQAAAYEPLVHEAKTYSFHLLQPHRLQTIGEEFSWTFLDWVLDEMSGLQLCRRLRAQSPLADTHVTMVLERDDSDARRRALKAGADDYLVAPLSRQIILDRVLSLDGNQPRPSPAAQPFARGDLSINLASEQAYWAKQPLSLRPNEFRVLRFMAENPNRVLTRQELVIALGKAGDPDYLRTVDVWIKRLRGGLKEAGGANALRTVHGKGYVLDLPGIA